MARISGVDLPPNKRVEIGLTYIFGIGRPTSQKILDSAKVSPNTRVKDLSEDEVSRIRKTIQEDHTVEGDLRKDVQTLVETTHRGLLAGIAAVKVGGRVGDIGAAVEAVAKERGYGVVREYVGHGVGTSLHEEPQIPNFGQAGKGALIKKGMTLAIEPMFNLGTAKVRRGSDGWTISTVDGRPSAHFEHTVLAMPEGPVVLGFGRYTADRVEPGWPGFHEYPVVTAQTDRAVAALGR